MQQHGYGAAIEIILGLDHGARGVGDELALPLVGAAGQVVAVGELEELIVIVLAHDGAHLVFAGDRAGVVAVTDVDFRIVAVAQDAAHAAAGAVHRNSALVGAVLDGAGADVAHHAGHAVGVRRTGNVAGVEAAFHRGFRCLSSPPRRPPSGRWQWC